MKIFRIAAAGAVALLAWGCLLTPGKFEAGLQVRKDGSFTYRYAGEILLMTAHSVMGAALAAESEEAFDPESRSCWKDQDSEDGEPETRDCTPEEIETHRREWEEGRARRAEEQRRNSEMMKAMLGGIDPSDPKTMDDFARRLQGYEGWKRVVHKGNGVFDVEYEISGRLDHDFVYPVFPGVDFIIPFVQVTRRTGGKVRIVAPALVEGSDGTMSGSAMGRAMQGMDQSRPPGPIKKPEGQFTLTTDAEILTNNTEDGPSTAAGSKVLKWVVGPLDAKKPEALLQL